MNTITTPAPESHAQRHARLTKARRHIKNPYPRNSLSAMWFDNCRGRELEEIKADHAETRRQYSGPQYLSTPQASELYAEARFVQEFEPEYQPYPLYK